jgi:dihydroorotase/N-acyl-D-amino-acid deacylase
VSPGFIDTHSHGRRGAFDVPSAENQIRQGVTTIIEGPDGSSPYPIKPFLDRFSKVPATTDFGLLLGQGTVREQVIGLKDRKATEEIARMEGMVRQAMLDGAFGLSTRPVLPPGRLYPTEEVAALAKVARRHGRCLHLYMRSDPAAIDAVEDHPHRGAGRHPVQITHHKVIGRANSGPQRRDPPPGGRSPLRGLDVTIDQYPYTASSTGLAALSPNGPSNRARKPSSSGPPRPASAPACAPKLPPPSKPTAGAATPKTW